MRVTAGEHSAQNVKRVLVDGKPIRRAIWADDETGEVEHFVYDAEGHPVIAPDGEHFATELSRGVVTIEMKS